MELRELGETSLLPPRPTRGWRWRMGVAIGAVGLVLLFSASTLLAFIGNRVAPSLLLVPMGVALVLILIGYFLIR